MRIVVLGLSITSSWGNGHATTYRGLVRALAKRGHDVLFLERDQPWYAANRDLPKPLYVRAELYESLQDLKDRFTRAVRDSDLAIVGSYVPQGIAVGDWVLFTAGGITAFYDIDTPVTLAKLDRGDADYISRALVMRYDLYLSFTGGPTLRRIEKNYYSPRARVLYCSVDPEEYYPEQREQKWDLGYLGTYSKDRQPTLDSLMLRAAASWPGGRFMVAGPLYPETIEWPANVERVDHLAPGDHRSFYNSQAFTLNVTRADMVKAGWSPSVRLFEAAACGAPIVSDRWEGLGELFKLDSEILLARSAEDTLRYVRGMGEEERRALGERARQRVLAEHTCDVRARELEAYALELLGQSPVKATESSPA